MRLRRASFLLALFAAFALTLPAALDVSRAEARPGSDAKKSSEGEGSSKAKRRARRRRARKAKRRRRVRARKARARKARRAKNRRRARRRKRNVRGRAAKGEELRQEAAAKPSGEVWVYSVNFKEEVKVDIYNERGEVDDAALAVLDGVFRCKRTDEVRAVDPRLYRVLSTIYERFGKRQIHLISGFRFQRNEGSRHYHASAMDIRIPGVPLRKLWRFAKSLDTGGMGIGLYPRAGFIHVDFRAPGTPSYRWIDRSRPGSGGRGKRPNRRWRKLRSKKPNT